MPNRTATIQTNHGTIKLLNCLRKTLRKPPRTSACLPKKGYYDGVIFHRVINGFVIQRGDPDGTGRGGASAWGGRFNDEIDSSSEVYRRGYKAGNGGHGQRGSEHERFAILHHASSIIRCRRVSTIFGRVTEGQTSSTLSRLQRPAPEIGPSQK